MWPKKGTVQWRVHLATAQLKRISLLREFAYQNRENAKIFRGGGWEHQKSEERLWLTRMDEGGWRAKTKETRQNK